MIKFIIGRSGSGKSQMLTEMVAELLKNKESKAVFIVPEQETVVWETKFAEKLPASANLQLEVTNFTRLANSVFREYGGLAEHVIDEGSRVLIMWRAILSVWDNLQFYNKLTNREEGSITTLLGAVDELKESGITPKDAEKAIGLMQNEEKSEHKTQSGDGRNDEDIGRFDEGEKTDGDANKRRYSTGKLSERLSDVALVYSAYNAILHEEYIDKADLDTKLVSVLRNHPYFAKKMVFVDSFMSFTVGQEKILREIFRTAENVAMSFTLPASNGTMDVTKYEIENFDGEITFLETIDSFKRMRLLAARVDKEYEIIRLFENHRHENNPELKLIERYLFDYSYKFSDEISFGGNENIDVFDKNVGIIECRDKYSEAQACSCIVANLVRQGYNMRDIAIVSRDISKYEGIVDAALRRHKFPCYISRSGGIMQNPAVRFVEASLAVAVNGWRKQDIICLLKTGLTLLDMPNLAGISGDAFEIEAEADGEQAESTEFYAEILEKYLDTWDVRSRKMYARDWSMNPAGYKIGISEYGKKILKIVNRARKLLIDPLDEFLSVFDSAESALNKENSGNIAAHGFATVRQIAEKIVDYAEAVDIESGLKRIGNEYRNAGMASEAEKIESGWRLVCEILDKMVEILDSKGDCGESTLLNAGKFLDLFARVAALSDIGAIPSGIDEIMIGNAREIRLDGIKCIIILGSNEGEFPGNGTNNRTFFAQSERVILEQYGLNFNEKNAEILSARDYCMYYRSVSAASDKLFVLTESNESEGARRIEYLTGEKKIKFSRLSAKEVVFDEESLRDYCMEKNIVVDYKTEYEKANNDNSDIEKSVDNKNRDLKQRQIGLFDVVGETLYLSQTKIETYVNCPFDYACKYKIGIEPKAVGTVTMPDIGTIIHHMLEMFFSRNIEKDFRNFINDETILTEELDKILLICKSEIKESMGELEYRIEYLFNRIKVHMSVFVTKILKDLLESGFKPVYYEKKIGRGGFDSLKITTEDGNTVILEGVADRIDVFEEDGKSYVQIIDYKTGNKVFSAEKIKDGMGVQLLVYLFSLVKNKRNNVFNSKSLLPGSALYYSTNLTSVKAEPNESVDSIKMKAEANIVVSGIKNVNIVKKDAENSKIFCYDMLSFEAVFKELKKVIADIGDKICREIFEPIPGNIDKTNSCIYCNNEYICRKKRAEVEVDV